MVKGIGDERIKLTVSLWKDDIAKVHDMYERTGADTLSEVVRECIRERFEALKRKSRRRPKAGGQGGHEV